MRIHELPAKLRERGLTVREVAGWETRGNEFPTRPDGALRHWDAIGSKAPTAGLGVITNGRPDLAGPLAQVYQSRYTDANGLDIVYVVASGKANHAGAGEWNGISGNYNLLGVEIAWSGPSEPFPAKRKLTSELVMRALLDCCAGTNPNDVCFPADTLVLTKRGLVPIQEVGVGDEALTHKNRWRKVVAVGNRVADTIVVRGHGHPGLVTTPDHPFLAQVEPERRVKYKGFACGSSYPRTLGTEWVPASDLAGRFWSSPAVPYEEAVPNFTPEQAWIAGHYVAEGWALQQGRDPVALAHACHVDEADEIIQRAKDAGWHAARSRKTSTGKSQCVRIACGKEFVSFVRSNFNEKAHNKELPVWLFTAPKDVKISFMEGYFYGDGWKNHFTGHKRGGEFLESRTVSKKLAVGLRLLAHSLGWASAMYIAHKGGSDLIKGRDVTRRVTYQIRVRPYESNRGQGFFTEDHFCGRVREVSVGDTLAVYNITVEEDESYVADGIVVHNCEHREYALPRGRKIDTNLDGNELRRRMVELNQPAPALPPSIPRPSGAKDRLRSGESMRPGESLTSNTGWYRFAYQGDGNLVVYVGFLSRPSDAIWQSRTNGKRTSRLSMQSDGNLVLYDDNKAVWHTGTHGHPGAYVVMQGDGNLVIYHGNRAIWGSKQGGRI